MLHDETADSQAHDCAMRLGTMIEIIDDTSFEVPGYVLVESWHCVFVSQNATYVKAYEPSGQVVASSDWTPRT